MVKKYLAAALAGFALCASGSDFMIAVRGERPTVTVVLPGAPGESRRYAAEELVKYVRRMTGVELPVGGAGARRIVISADPSRADDGFSIRCRGDELEISGSETRGALYGVYALLERLGCVFCSADFDKVPVRDSLSVSENLAVEETPAFEFRDVIDRAAGSPEFCAKIARNSKTWGRLPAKFGGKALMPSRRLCGHTFETLISPKEFFASHPEYFSEVNGRRVGERSQLCLTNPDVLEIVASRVLDAMRAEPEARVFAVSANDWYNHCTCARCRAIDEREGSPSGSYVEFVNAVARRTAKEFPQNYIRASAYMHTRRPPKTLSLERNVFFTLSPIECDYFRPLDASRYEENVKAVEEMRDWVSRGGAFVYTDYTANFSHYPIAFPNLDSIAGSLRFCRSIGMRGVTGLGAHDSSNAFMQELRSWVFAKLAWNPDRDTWSLVRTFCDAYYGPAADIAFGYLKRLHALPRDTEKEPLKLHEGFRHPSVPDAFLDWAYDEWTRAETLAAGDPAILGHVRAAKFSTAYHILGRHLGMVYASTGTERLAALREAAGWTVAFVESARSPVIVSEHGRPFPETGMFRAWKRFQRGNPYAFASGRGVAEEDLFTLYGGAKDREIVDDPLALDGKAVRISPNVRNWVVQLNCSDMRTDPGSTYRLKVRARPGDHAKDAEGVAFRAGVNMRGAGSSSGRSMSRRFMRKDAPGGAYRWYDVGEFEPADGKYVWVSSEGPDGLNVDSIAICKELQVLDGKGRKVAAIPSPSARIAYGEHPLQYVELWIPEDREQGASRWPVAVYVHGGGWVKGRAVDTIMAPRLMEMLDRGVAVASVSYRLLGDVNGVNPPVKAVMDDIAAAIRRLKAGAEPLGIDAARLGLVGGSAGACAALSLSLSGGNPLGVKFVAALYPQTTLDPREMKAWIPNQGQYGAHAFGLSWGAFMARREALLPQIERYSPAALARAIDPKFAPEIVMEYPSANFPAPDGTPSRDPVHSALFGTHFERLCRSRGIACTLLKGPCREAWKRLADALTANHQ